EDPLAVPRRHELQRVLRRVGDAGALDPRIEPLHVDEARSQAIGLGGDRARQRLLARLTTDHDDLAGLDVRAETYGELRETVVVSVVHRARAYYHATAMRLDSHALDELQRGPFGVYVHVPWCASRC